MPPAGARLSTDLDEIYSSWFAADPDVLRLFDIRGLKRPLCEGIPQVLCTQCGRLQGSGDCASCGSAEMAPVFRVTAVNSNTGGDGIARVWHDPTCPACGSRYRQILLGARIATLGSVAVEQSWASPFNDDKKLIAFSDSVQDAAHRAGFFAARTYRHTVRTGLARVIDCVASPRCDWPAFLEAAGNAWFDEASPLWMDETRFVSEFIGPNMMAE
jgi:DEAD/DEAH box helicase domain-containing protein